MTEESSWTLSNGFWPLPLCLGLIVFLKISEYKDQKRIRYTAITLVGDIQLGCCLKLHHDDLKETSNTMAQGLLEPRSHGVLVTLLPPLVHQGIYKRRTPQFTSMLDPMP